MKTIQYTAFGHSDVLQLAQVEKPAPQENEVLIKIVATTVNPMDMKLREGYLQKLVPIQFPFSPGLDVSGIIEAVGDQVTLFKVGDEVFSPIFGGTYTEYVTIKEGQIALKPNNLSHNEAAALAVPLTTAYTLLVEEAQIKAGDRLLIHGAAGAVGAVMLQMAKAFGVYVIATASGKGVDMAKVLGADEVIDYKSQDFTRIAKDMDVVADLVGGETQTKSFGVLKKGGRLLSVVMPPSGELAEQFGVTAKFLNSAPSPVKLNFGKKLVEAGKIKAHITKVFKLEQAAQAQDLVSAGGVNGKIILEVGVLSE